MSTWMIQAGRWAVVGAVGYLAACVARSKDKGTLASITSSKMPEPPPLTGPDDDPSRLHRELWNKLGEKEGIQWVADTGRLHQIDSFEEITLTEEARRRFGISKNINFTAALPLQAAILRANQELEEKRREALKVSYSLRAVYEVNPDVSHLTEPEKEMVRRLIPALEALKQWNMKLKDRRGPEFHAYLQRTGDRLGLEEFERQWHNACSPALPLFLGADAAFCSPVDYFPNIRPTTGFQPNEQTPWDLSETDTTAMGKAYPDKDPMWNPLLVPMTSVSRDPWDPRGWSWTKVTRDDRYPEAAEVARYIAYAAATPGLDPSLAAQLRVTAESHRNDDPFSNYKVEAEWVRQQTGNIEALIVGLKEGYTPMQKMVEAGLILGIETEGEVRFARQYLAPLVPTMETRMSELIGTDEGGRRIYEVRAIPNTTVIRFVEPLAMTTGEAFVGMAHAGPTTGPVAKEGLAKRVAFPAVFKAKADLILLPMAPLVMVPEQVPYVSTRHFTLWGIGHEMTHPIGPRPDQASPDGQRVVDRIGDELFSQVEESKSNAGGVDIFTLLNLQDPRVWNEEDQKKLVTTYICNLIRQMRFGGRAHGGGAGAELGFYISEGGVRLRQTEADGKQVTLLEVNYEKAGPAIARYMGSVGKNQALGDKAGVEELLAFGPHMPEAIDGIIHRVNEAGIPVDIVIKLPPLQKLVGEPSYPPKEFVL